MLQISKNALGAEIFCFIKSQLSKDGSVCVCVCVCVVCVCVEMKGRECWLERVA